MNFDLGEYGGYIWACYALSVVALGGMTVWAVAAYARARAQLKSLEKR